MAVIDIRGTHGSGKSTIVHRLIDRKTAKVVSDDDGNPIALTLCRRAAPDSIVVGVDYLRTDCAGCDNIKPTEEISRRVRYLALRFRYVVLEGILVSHTFARYNALAEELGDYRFLFLDTPLDVCIRRVSERRVSKGKPAEFDPKNVVKDHHNVYTVVRGKLERAGRTVRVIPWQDPMPAVLEEFRG